MDMTEVKINNKITKTTKKLRTESKIIAEGRGESGLRPIMNRRLTEERAFAFKWVPRLLYTLFLWNEYDDEYLGYEEQGISYDEWKKRRNKQ